MPHLTGMRRVRSLLLGAVTAVATIAALAIAPAASAAPTYSLSGTITYAGAATTTSDASTFVQLFPVSGDARVPGQYVTSVGSVGTPTTWELTGIPSGRYRIFFGNALSGDKVGPGTGDVWYGNTSFEDQATVVTVDHDLTGLDVDRPAAGSISGTITDTKGAANTFDVQAWLYNPGTGLFEQAMGYGDVNTTSSGNYTIRNLAPGKYVVRFGSWAGRTDSSSQYYSGKDEWWQSQPVTVTAGQNVTAIDGTVGPWTWRSGRLAGGDRFETSAQISSSLFIDGTTAGSGPVTYVASGVDFPDALSASAAAARLGGPLLLTRPDVVPASVVTELQRLKPQKIVVVGGANAVGSAAFSQLQALAPVVTRVAGADRFGTSRAVVTDAFGSDHVTSVFIATGRNFPDALVAGSAAGYQYGPLLLVNGAADSVDSDTKALITSLSPSRIYIVGGVNTISPAIQADLETLGAPEVVRLAGGDRFGTAQVVNREVFPFADDAYVASGLGFPDALSISAVAGALGSPLLLAPPQCLPYGEVTDSTALGVSTYWAVGGPNVLSSNITDLVECPQGMYGLSAGTLSSKSADVPAAPTSPEQADPSTLRGALSAVSEGLRKH